MEHNEKLLNGKIGSLLFNLALPAILAQLVNVAYNIVDRMYIGRIPVVGTDALTGLGLAFPILMIISASAALIGMGGAPLASIALGKKDHKQAEKILGNSFIGLLILGITLTGVFYFFKEDLLVLFGASSATLPYANEYLSIYLLGSVFVMMSLGLNTFLNAQGFAKFGMMTVVIGAIINIILDPIFIFGFDMGVQGAALATIIAQGVSAIWVVWFLCSKKSTIRIKKENFKLDYKLLGMMIALGVSPFIMQSTESLVSIVFNTQLASLGGDLYVATMVVLSSITQIILLPVIGLTQGAQPIIGYNYGAHNMERVKKTIRLALTCAMIYTTGMWAFAQFAPTTLASIFTGDPELISLCAQVLKIYFFGAFILGAQLIFQNAFIALGQAKVSMFLALLRKVILLIPLVFMLPKLGFGVLGIYLAQPIADVLSTATTCVMFYIKSKILLKD